MTHIIWVIRFSMSHNRIQDPIFASFNALFDTLTQIKPHFSEFLAFSKNWAYFESKMGFFWVGNGLFRQKMGFFGSKWAYFESKMGFCGSKWAYFESKWAFWVKNGFILTRPEMNADFETQPGNCWTWNSLLKPPCYETRARNSIQFWPQMTPNDLLTSRKQY